MVSNGVNTCEVAQCRLDDVCWRPLCPYRRLTMAAVETERKETPDRRRLSRGGAGGAVRRVAVAADGRKVGG